MQQQQCLFPSGKLRHPGHLWLLSPYLMYMAEHLVHAEICGSQRAFRSLYQDRPSKIGSYNSRGRTGTITRSCSFTCYVRQHVKVSVSTG